jgi:hypothetical protein
MKTLLTSAAHRLRDSFLSLQATRGCPFVLACLLALVPWPASAASARAASVSPDQDSSSSTAATAAAEAGDAPKSDVTIEANPEAETSRKDVPWLGVSTTEASETLASQLDLEPGVGLVVTYVAPESPASKSGFRKNDVLVQFEDQSLVHPAQLRKLVRVRKQGDVVKLGFYRAGKRETASVTLGLTGVQPGPWDDEGRALKGNLKELHKQLQDLHIDEAVRDQMRVIRQSLGNIKIDQKEVQEDIRHGMEQARQAIQEALRNVTNADPVRKVLENLAHSGVIIDDKADVIVRSSGKNVKSMVKSDDTGTIVLVSNPKLHLTAHDKEGKLLFDGPIESTDERAKVPRDLWERVEPLVKQMEPAAEEPESKESK